MSDLVGFSHDGAHTYLNTGDDTVQDGWLVVLG